MEPIAYEQAETLGVSRPAYDEIIDILGHQPSIDELSTMLAMWDSNGRQQGFYTWLCGQFHATHRDEYLYSGATTTHQSIREPRIKECLDIASALHANPIALGGRQGRQNDRPSDCTLLYLVGNVGAEFLGSDYAQRYLHIAENPIMAETDTELGAYIDLIVSALCGASLAFDLGNIGSGGLFAALLQALAPQGFDIIAPREVRLDAFLFGEESARRLVATSEAHDDAFLLKMDEARLNCCFLGHTTKNRVMIDGFDFGPVARFVAVQ